MKLEQKGSSSVLVIEDDPDMRGLLVLMLEDQGHRVLAASDGREGLDVAERIKPDLILLDMKMPVMDGFEFRRAQQSDGDLARIPTVIISALHQMSRRVAELAVDDALAKPIDIELLLRVVARHSGAAPPEALAP